MISSQNVSPAELGRELAELLPENSIVVVDEVQKLPQLLDVMHRSIELRKKAAIPGQFVLTRSSARKLKRGAANLLGKRAFVLNLFPLTSIEIGGDFELQRALEWGTLPEAWLAAEDRQRYLTAYARTFLKEEIWDEHIVRKLPPFRKFLEVAAQLNGEIVNYSKIARDVGADAATVNEYFQILEDTLSGPFLNPSTNRYENVKHRARSSISLTAA